MNKTNWHDFSKAFIATLWHLSPLLVACIAMNFWILIKDELDGEQ